MVGYSSKGMRPGRYALVVTSMALLGACMAFESSDPPPFPPASPDGGDGSTPDGGSPSDGGVDADDAASPADAAPDADAGVPATMLGELALPALVCDDFARTSPAILTGPLLATAQFEGEPDPTIDTGSLVMKRDPGEAATLLISQTKARHDSAFVSFRVKVSTSLATTTERVRLVVLDTSVGAASSSFVALEIENGQWRVQWRDYTPATPAEKSQTAGKVVANKEYTVALGVTVRPAGGLIWLRVDGNDLIKTADLKLDDQSRRSWQFTLGPLALSTAGPAGNMSFANLCASPFVNDP